MDLKVSVTMQGLNGSITLYGKTPEAAINLLSDQDLIDRVQEFLDRKRV